MRIVVISQQDHFAIPRNVERLLAVEGVEVPLVVTVDSGGALLNRKARFAKGFGAAQSGRMASAIFWARSLDALDRASGYRWLRRRRSVRAVAGRHGIAYRQVSNPNHDAFIEHLEGLAADLVVSYSAPCKFSPRLLAVPRLGCLNLHCSLLPAYAGLLPSFWVLYHQERETGVTVHLMDEEIDTGTILDQVRLPIEPGVSMFRLIRQTKKAGGDLTARIVEQWTEGETRPQSNLAEQGSYFSWPTVEQIRSFRRRGGRLI